MIASFLREHLLEIYFLILGTTLVGAILTLFRNPPKVHEPEMPPSTEPKDSFIVPEKLPLPALPIPPSAPATVDKPPVSGKKKLTKAKIKKEAPKKGREGKKKAARKKAS